MARSAPITSSIDPSPDYITVQSTNGFSQGDLVYAQNGTYGPIPNGAITAASFDATIAAPIYGYGFGGYGVIDNTSGSAKENYADKLTNGNTVQAYFKYSNGRPAFRIVDSSGAIVVAETEISTVYINLNAAASIGVVALSGGGFVVYWLNHTGGAGAGYANYAIYSNTGSVVTAATQDTGAGASTTNNVINATALPNGGFVLAYTITTGTVAYFRVFDATGTGVTSWTSLGTVAAATQHIALAARSNSEFVVVFVVSTSVTTYNVYNATGALQATGSLTPVIGTGTLQQRELGACVLANGTTFVLTYIAYDSGIGDYYPCFRLLPSGNLLGAENYIPAVNVFLGAFNVTSPALTKPEPLSAGGFIYFFGDAARQIEYVVYDNSGTVLSGTNAFGAVPRTIPSSAAIRSSTIATVEQANTVDVYWATGSNTSSVTINQSAIAINKTTYEPVPVIPSTISAGVVTTSVNTYSPSNSGPTYAKFLASTSLSSLVTKSLGVARSNTIITSTTCDSIAAATLPDGKFVVAYRDANTYVVKFTVFSSSGNALQTVTVGTGSSGAIANGYALRVTALSSGAIVVAYSTSSSSALTVAIYAAVSYILVTSFSFTAATSTGTRPFDVSALNNDRFAVAFIAGNKLFYAVYSSTGAVLSSAIQIGTDNYQSPISIVGTSTGSFAIYAYSSTASAYKLSSVINTTGNTFSLQSETNLSIGTVVESYNMVGTSTGAFATLSNTNTSPAVNIFPFGGGGAIGGALQFSTSAITNYGALGVTGFGSFVFIDLASTTKYLYAMPAGVLGGGSSSLYTSSITDYRFDVTTSLGGGFYSAGAQPTFTPGIGNQIVLVTLDNSRFPQFCIIDAWPFTEAISITSGVSVSNAVPIAPYSQDTSYLSGYVLQGVAMTNAAAGGFGKVQTIGNATLNTNYSASTPATSFDHQTPNRTGISGVKGTIVGRNVVLEGKS